MEATCKEKKSRKLAEPTVLSKVQQGVKQAEDATACKVEQDGESEPKLTDLVQLRYPVRQYPEKGNLLRGEVVLNEIQKQMMEDTETISSLNFSKTLEAYDGTATFYFKDMPEFCRDFSEFRVSDRKLANMKIFRSWIFVKDMKIQFRCGSTVLCFPYSGTGFLKIKKMRVLLVFSISQDGMQLESLKGCDLKNSCYILNSSNIFVRNRMHQKISAIMLRHKEDIKDSIVQFLQEVFKKYFSNYHIPGGMS